MEKSLQIEVKKNLEIMQVPDNPDNDDIVVAKNALANGELAFDSMDNIIVNNRLEGEIRADTSVSDFVKNELDTSNQTVSENPFDLF